MSKANTVGKGLVALKDVISAGSSLVSVPIFSKRHSKIVGQLFVSVSYIPRSKDLYELEHLSQLTSAVDKYEYFDSLLYTCFNVSCHFGYLRVELAHVDIPVLKQGELYLIKLKEGSHVNEVTVQAPNLIMDQQHSQFFTSTASPNERIHLEFFQVDQGEDGKQRNLKLVQLLTIPIKYLPFDGSNTVADHRFLVNLPNKCGKVAQLGFNFDFTPQVDESFLKQPLDPMSGALLFFKLVQSEEFSYHHSKDLDKYTFSLEVSNETKGVSFVKRLYFNKVQFPIGFLEIRIGDKVKLVVRVQRGGKEETVI